VEGQVAQGRNQHEAKRGQRVGEERSPELRRTAEKRDDHEGRNVQRRNDTQGTHPLDSRDGPRITDFPRKCEIHEVEEREPASQEDAEDGPEQAPHPCGPDPDRQEERYGDERQAGCR
jgi:hypothetical protein